MEQDNLLVRQAEKAVDSIKKGQYYTFPRISSEYVDCSLPLTGDTNNICTGFFCKYCFAAYQKSVNPSLRGEFQFKTVKVEHIKEILEGKHPENPYYKNFIQYRFPIHIGGLSDCQDKTEPLTSVTYNLLKVFIEHNYPVIISTKGTYFTETPEYYKLFEQTKQHKNFAFQFSIITNDDKQAEKIEVGVPSTTARLASMKKLSELGYWTILRLRPFIIGLTDIGLEELLTRSREAGAKAISLEFFCFDVRCGSKEIKKRYKLMSDLLGFDMEEYYRKLSPSERGGYRRLNRDVKEIFVKRMWKKCHELGIQFNTSDPDFKELNESGSCCGLPETKEKYNSDLINWSRGQLTYHMKELRKRYWASNGEDKYLTWDMIAKDVPHNWMKEHRFYGDSLKNWHSDFGKTKMGYGHEFLQTWNNLRSAGNPYSYFHGKIKPSHVDKNGNIVYKYIPHPYETRWRKEGIL